MSPVSIVGVLNVTPDSFHDGGQFITIDAAVRQAEKMIVDGADIIEIGGQSSLDAKLISPGEECGRVIPVLTALRKKFPSVPFSIDTMISTVAEEGMQAGAMMINDVSAGRRDPRILFVVAAAGVRLVLMHSKEIPPADKGDRKYDDVVRSVSEFLSGRIEAAIASGVRRENIIIDPGLGFFVSSDAAYSLQILARLREFSSLGPPIFISPSRKSFLAGPQKLPPSERLPGTIAASVIAVMNGAAYVRTHDVLEVKRGCEVAVRLNESGKWKEESGK